MHRIRKVERWIEKCTKWWTLDRWRDAEIGDVQR